MKLTHFDLPKEPTLAEELTAIVCDHLKVERPEGAKTLAEWQREYLAEWFKHMTRLMEAGPDRPQ